MDLRSFVSTGLAMMAWGVIAPAQAQPPVEQLGQTELVCSLTHLAHDLAVNCPAVPQAAEASDPAVAHPQGFDRGRALAARGDERGPGFYVFGERGADHAGPYLAFAPPGLLDVPEAWEFFTGRGLSGSTNWVSYHRWQIHTGEQGEWNAGKRASVFSAEAPEAGCGGFQAEWNAGLKRWLMFYACKGESRVRVAAQSWGPWSEALALGSNLVAQDATLLASQPAPANGSERVTAIYWAAQQGATTWQVFRSTLRQDGRD